MTRADAGRAAIDVDEEVAAVRLRDAAGDDQPAGGIARRKRAAHVHVAVDQARSAGGSTLFDPDVAREGAVATARAFLDASADPVRSVRYPVGQIGTAPARATVCTYVYIPVFHRQIKQN